MSPADSTWLLIILAVVAVTGLLGLALLWALVRLVLRLEQRVASGISDLQQDLKATATQVRDTSRQMGVVLGELSQGARYGAMVWEVWRAILGRPKAAAPTTTRRNLWTQVGIPLGVMAARALAARIRSRPPDRPNISG
jgi:hypothetical protein